MFGEWYVVKRLKRVGSMVVHLDCKKDMVGNYYHRTSLQWTISLRDDVNCILRRCNSRGPAFTPHTKNRLCIWFVKHNKLREFVPDNCISVYALILYYYVFSGGEAWSTNGFVLILDLTNILLGSRRARKLSHEVAVLDLKEENV